MSKSIVNEKIIKEEIKNYGIDIDDKAPKWVQNFDKKAYSDYSLEVYEGIKYLLIDKQFKIEEDKIVNYYRTVKQLVNMTGIEICSNILIDFNPKKNSLLLHNILIYRDDNGPINKLLSADLQVLRREYRAEMKVLSGDATLSIILDDIKINDIIDVSFSIIDNSELEKDFFSRIVQLEYGPSVHQFHLSIITDTNYPLKHKFLGVGEKQVKHSKHLNQNILTYIQTNTPSLTNYKFQPPWYIAGSFIQLSKRKKLERHRCTKFRLL